MHVLGHRVGDDRAVGGACDDHAQLDLEVELAARARTPRRRAGPRPRRARGVAGGAHLALAVVAEAGGLQDAAVADPRRGIEVVARRRALPTGPSGAPLAARNAFSATRSWAMATAAGDGATSVRAASRASAAAGRFSNSVVTTAHSAASASRAPRSSNGATRWRSATAPAGAYAVGVEHQGAVAHRAGREQRVAAELAAAEHADRRRRGDGAQGAAPGSRRACAASARRRRAIARQRGGEGLVVGREQGDGEQGGVGRAGLADRERGDRDAGRHLHDRVQRILPAEVLRRHRHAEHRHGRLGGQHARQVGGAAGAGDDRPQAASRALSAKANISSGMRWALTTSASWATPNSPSVSAARRIVGQSLADPITTATRGAPSGSPASASVVGSSIVAHGSRASRCDDGPCNATCSAASSSPARWTR